MESKVRRPQANAAKCDLVYFVGGYTLAEVAALRTVQVSLTGLVPEISSIFGHDSGEPHF